MRDPVVIEPWVPAWADRFAAERERVLALFVPVPIRVEHIGSTAVPGLAAKPIVDMLVGVEHLPDFEARIPDLEDEGWEYIPEYESFFPDRRFLAKAAAAAP